VTRRFEATVEHGWLDIELEHGPGIETFLGSLEIRRLE
jgi:hypothetical protein